MTCLRFYKIFQHSFNPCLIILKILNDLLQASLEHYKMFFYKYLEFLKQQKFKIKVIKI